MVCDMHLHSRSRHPGQGEAAIRDPGFSMASRLPDNRFRYSDKKCQQDSRDPAHKKGRKQRPFLSLP
jgi:hypothetical protein